MITAKGYRLCMARFCVFIIEKRFCAPKSNAYHAESMRRCVGAVGVLYDIHYVIGRGTGSTWPDSTC